MDFTNIESFKININNFGFDKPVFLNACLEIKHPGLYILNDENGAGKTTLLKLIANYHSFNGNIYINNIIIDDKDSYQDNFISYVNQDILIFEDKSLIDNVLLPYSNKDKQKAIDILHKFRLFNCEYQNASSLSEGEKKRLYLSRIFYDLKPIILLDEITTSLDEYNCSIIYEVLNELKNDHIILLVSHECLSVNKNDSFIKIEKKSIKLIDNDLKNSQQVNINYQKISSIKDTKNIMKLHPKTQCLTILFYILFMVLTIVSHPVYNSFNYKASNNEFSSYQELKINTYLYNSPLALIYKNNLVFDDNEFYNYSELNSSLIKNQRNNAGDLFSGLFTKKNYDNTNLDLLYGKYPKLSNEVLISNYHYDVLKSEIAKNKNFNEEQIKAYIFNDYKIIDYYKVVGIYSGNTNTKSFKQRIINANEKDFSTHIRASYGFMIESIFGISDENSPIIGVINNERNKKELSENKKFIVYDIARENYDEMIMINKNADDKLYFFKQSTTFKMFYIVSFIGLIILCIVDSLSYYQLHKEETLVLRYDSLSEKRLKKAHFFNRLFEIIAINIVSIILSLIIIALFNAYISNNIIDSLFWYISINYIPFLMTLFITLCFLFFSNFTITNLLVKKDFAKQLIEIKRK